MNKYNKINEKNIKKVNNVKKHYGIYNAKYYCLKGMYYILDSLYKTIPIVVSTTVLLTTKFSDNKPFITDNIYDTEKVINYDTKTSHREEKNTEKIDSTDDIIEVHTPWIINKLGLYEQNVYTYKFNKDIEFIDIYDMSINELNKVFDLINIKNSQKKYLSHDEKSNFDGYTLIITHSNKKGKSRKETPLENIENTLLFAYMAVILGYIIHRINNRKFKIYFKDYVNTSSYLLNKLNDEDIEKALSILEKNRERLRVK